MIPFEPSNYGPAFAPLLETDRRRPLDAGKPDRGARDSLTHLSLETAFPHTTVVDREMASCCLSGVWLLHDFLDESHTISQSIETPSGSYWHAIMHRREGDFSNAKYWLRRVGRHPVIASIGEYAAASLRDVDSDDQRRNTKNPRLGETRPRDGNECDPFEFVDRCEAAVRRKSKDREVCLDIQQAEWELLFEFCYREAIARSSY